MFIEGGT